MKTLFYAIIFGVLLSPIQNPSFGSSNENRLRRSRLTFFTLPSYKIYKQIYPRKAPSSKEMRLIKGFINQTLNLLIERTTYHHPSETIHRHVFDWKDFERALKIYTPMEEAPKILEIGKKALEKYQKLPVNIRKRTKIKKLGIKTPVNGVYLILKDKLGKDKVTLESAIFISAILDIQITSYIKELKDTLWYH